MKILITGSTGLLGQALVKRLAPYGEVIGLSRHDVSVPGETAHVACDLTDAKATARALHDVAPEVVIHAQALSDVDRCEREPELAHRMNAEAVEHVCHALRQRSVPVLAVSTDYVFDGTKPTAYDEADDPHPISVYGHSKWAGERAALGYAETYVIRPSTLFGIGRTNFCDTIVERVRAGQPVDAFLDQRTSPTYTEDLAEGIGWLLQALSSTRTAARPRIYHVTNTGGCLRTEFAHRIVELLAQSPSLIVPIRMAQRPRPAPRPPNSVLTSRVLAGSIGRTLRPWDEALQAYLRQRHWIN